MISMRKLLGLSYSFSNIVRKNFKKLDENDISYFKRILNSNSILTDSHDV